MNDAPTAPSPAIAALMASPAYRRAADTLAAEHDRTVEDIVTLTQIPSPPFGEEQRAQAYLEMLRAHGLDDVEMDGIGNVMGIRRGTGNGPMLVVAAHLDTVFPAGTDVTVRREGTKLFAPGVGDDTRSLAVLLAYMRAMDAAGIRTQSDILFVGDVGEEGLGDLRGVRHLFTEGKYRDRIKAFITVDSPDLDTIAVGGIGSKRYRVTFRGPGGHSFGAFGIVNPMYAMAQAMVELAKTQVPAKPKTTYAATVTGGGTSINAIPNEVWMDVDLRSQSADELARLETRFQAIVQQAVETENNARDTRAGRVSAELKLVGDRPAGATDMDSDLVRLATAAITAHGFAPRHEFSSTDANIPMSLGIPAIKIGSGGTGGRAHSLEEWIDVEKTNSVQGMTAGLTTILAVAGIAP
ncbi:M20/M25/M40 family metallo-hydrolase [Limobrevibacterium gyesilva]|uniref:M20/M25/M40 family metallo-hydrolase n=1 Tax=Limobrevibacterium gyesilva TaxID=2991712 RepID=A0AA42CHB0_9PROT|nr:M20/M25/M40 family metallo-hydrolase [Limobrevibacterium gyesilva]MCW3477061.1 M20/M25/M40 family metallo-hydrolase [Limobrevibacterium gyesilva]